MCIAGHERMKQDMMHMCIAGREREGERKGRMEIRNDEG